MDGDLDQPAERPLHVGAHRRIAGAVEHLPETGARAQVVAGVEEAVAEEEERIRRRRVTRVVVDDVGEDDAGADVVLQPIEELTVGEPLLDVGRAAHRLGPQRLPLDALELTFDVGELAGQLFEILCLAGGAPEQRAEQGGQRDPAAAAVGGPDHSSSPPSSLRTRPRSRTCSK